MTSQTKHTLLDSENPRLKRLLPVALGIFSRGIQLADPKRVVQVALIAIASSPLTWPMMVLSKGIHLLILAVVWWLLRDALAQYPSLEIILVCLALLAIFYQTIYEEILDLLLYFLVVITGGGFLRWMCKGYLEGAMFRQEWMKKQPMERLIGTMVAALRIEHRRKYDELMDLYIDSNLPDQKERLMRLLDEYEHSITDKSLQWD